MVESSYGSIMGEMSFKPRLIYSGKIATGTQRRGGWVEPRISFDSMEVKS
jgi:hypothetical protein